ncbi:MAG: molybdopterin-dependent oxidoreductase, partial [Candidatus Wallbacteria bacterium]|nr:molybdopterin-dependent oxidoreductase [Candidatus Wallbacteria bacterium]
MSVGKSCIRKDAYDKLTGREQFVADMHLPGTLHATMVMSAHAHAEFEKPDAGSAMQIPGAVTVLTASDIPGRNILPLVMQDMPFMATDHVTYHGQALALVVAATKKASVAMSRAVKVKYAPLEAVLSIERALEPSSPRLYGNDNIFKSYRIIKGNTDQAFPGAFGICENTYRTPYQEHAYLETQGMLAVPDADGSMTVYGSMQCPFYVRDAVAAVLSLPLSKVRIVQAATGGGFGGKEDIPSLIAAYASLAAWKCRKPVQLVLGREEDLLFSSKRHPALIHYKTAYTSEGRIVGCRVQYYLNAGAFATLSPVVMWRGTVHAAGPYRVNHVHV